MDILSKQLYVQSNSYDEIVSLVKSQEDRIQCIPGIQPIANKDLSRLASGYGMRIDPVYGIPKFHEGMDFGVYLDIPVGQSFTPLKTNRPSKGALVWQVRREDVSCGLHL